MAAGQTDGRVIAGAAEVAGHKNGDGGVKCLLAEHCISHMLVREGH